MSKWVLLIYKVPREPSAGRVYIWRKLKQLGAIALQDAAWVLPATNRTQEQFQWLAAEIKELGGEAILWNSDLADPGRAAPLAEQFGAQVDAEFNDILKALKKKTPDLKLLAERYREAAMRDYFQSPLGRQVRDKLLGTRGGKSK